MGQFVSYGPTESGADDTYCPDVFNDFGFTSASRSETISDQILSGADNGTYYASVLSNEIAANKWPCMIGGYGSENNEVLYYEPEGEAHEWVCDGSNITVFYYGTIDTYKAYSGAITTVTQYQSTYTLPFLHMNWGWEGYSSETGQTGQILTNNGWYDANTNYSQADAASTNFGYFQTIIHNIHP